MSRESQIADLLKADATLMTLLTGGVYTDEEAGVEGIRRGDEAVTGAAFDANGILMPCVLVRERDLVPDEIIRDLPERTASTVQVVEVYFYQFRGHAIIDQAKERSYFVLEGVRLPNSWPIMWDGDSGFIPDVGPVANSTTALQEWRIISLRKP